RFLRPYDQVLASWRRSIAHAYAPDNLFARYRHQIDHTYVNRIVPPARSQLTVANLRTGAVLAWRLTTRIALSADYRRSYRRATSRRAGGHAFGRGKIDAARGIGFVAPHLTQFSREALRAEQNASFYSMHARTGPAQPEPQPAAASRA